METTRKVLMMLNARYPADIRVKKEADALIHAGMEVHLLCLHYPGEAKNAIVDGIHVHRIRCGTTNYALAFWDVVMSVNRIHPRFRAAAARILAREHITVVHVHDLPLAGTALSLKKERNLYVIADFHENYPDALNTWFRWKTNPVARLKNYLFLHPSRWKRFEAAAAREADVVIAVVDEMKARLVNEYRIAPERVVVVTNTEEKAFANQAPDRSVYDTLSGKFIVTYSGGVGPHRGIDVAIQAMQYLSDLPDIQLAIVGSGSGAVMKRLRKMVEQLGLKSVHFFGYVPFSSFFSVMHFADVNIIPHQSNGHTDNTVPHKLFQGMMAGKPLLVSSSAPLKRLVETYQSGLVFQAGDPVACATMIRTLYDQPALRAQLGDNGRRATMEGDANWEHTGKTLVSLYQNLPAA